MGFYIDPTDGSSKESWLAEHGLPIAQEVARGILDNGAELPVCLIDNGFFKAAGIAYSPAEIEAFSDPHDSRSKKWFRVPRTDLAPFYPDAVKG